MALNDHTLFPYYLTYLWYYICRWLKIFKRIKTEENTIWPNSVNLYNWWSLIDRNLNVNKCSLCVFIDLMSCSSFHCSLFCSLFKDIRVILDPPLSFSQHIYAAYMKMLRFIKKLTLFKKLTWSYLVLIMLTSHKLLFFCLVSTLYVLGILIRSFLWLYHNWKFSQRPLVGN